MKPSIRTDGISWVSGRAGEVTLESGEIHVWKFSLDLDPEELKVAWDSLSEEERIRALRFRGEVLQNRFIAGRGWMRHLLSGYSGIAASHLKFDVLSHGKPVLRNGRDQVLPPVAFNLSHSQGCGLLAVGNHEPLGVDIEALNRDVEWDGVAKRFFSHQEWMAWSRLPAEDRIRGFFKIWTGKEAYLKALGFGLSCSLQSFSVNANPHIEAELLEKSPNEGGDYDWEMRFFDVDPGFVGTVAVGCGRSQKLEGQNS